MSALAGAWALWVLAVPGRRPNVPRWLPMTLGFAASGSMLAWGCWRLAVSVLGIGGYTPAEPMAVAVLQHGLSMAAGLVVLGVVITVQPGRQPRRATDLVQSGGVDRPETGGRPRR